MRSVQRIAILTHLRQGLDPDYYLARCQRQVWEPEGRRVVVHQGTGPPPPADVAFLHIDLTQVPADYAALAAAYPLCVNARVTDTDVFDLYARVVPDRRGIEVSDP